VLNVQIILMGRGYDLAQSAPDRLCLPDGATVDDALEAWSAHLPNGYPLAASCLVALSGEHLGTLAKHRGCTLKDGDELVLLVPVAGG
jgi:molybdopterin converting factor small subunit